MFPTKKYKVIYADPAWQFLTRSDRGKGRSPEQHYACMTIDDIKALPVASIADDDCMLLMWITDPLLPVGLDVIRAWGFEYKTVGFTWVKLNRKDALTKALARALKGAPDWLTRAFFFGMGYWTRANPEMCLLATRGSPKRLSRAVRQLLIAPVREHSRKPDETYGRIEALVGGPYIELFARTARPGWDSWGNEVNKFNPAC
jgi:N6-adenosine-specific RNA methylase IME4